MSWSVNRSAAQAAKTSKSRFTPLPRVTRMRSTRPFAQPKTVSLEDARIIRKKPRKWHTSDPVPRTLRPGFLA